MKIWDLGDSTSDGRCGGESVPTVPAKIGLCRHFCVAITDAQRDSFTRAFNAAKESGEDLDAAIDRWEEEAGLMSAQRQLRLHPLSNIDYPWVVPEEEARHPSPDSVRDMCHAMNEGLVAKPGHYNDKIR